MSKKPNLAAIVEAAGSTLRQPVPAPAAAPPATHSICTSRLVLNPTYSIAC